MAKHVFCTDLCLERGEPLPGTGDAPERALMLAWPRGKWRVPRWESVDMSEALSEAVHYAAHAGLHVALVDKVEAKEPLPTLTATMEGITASFTDDAALVRAIRDYADGKMFDGETDERTVIVCCTDSRRDACCARHGFSTYKALVAVADPDRFQVVQSTHIGGCRFAASLIVMPHRQRYGRMRPEDAVGFLAALDRGEVYLPAYKGRTDVPEAAQVAEIAAMNWAAENDIDTQDVTLVGDIPADAAEHDTLMLEASIGGHLLHVHLQLRAFFMQGNCEIVAEGRGKTELRWCLEAVSPAAGLVETPAAFFTAPPASPL